MDLYFSNIKRDVLENTDYRRVVYTLSGEKGIEVQIVLMNINIGEDIHLETHPDTTQILQIFEGLCVVEIGDPVKNLALGKHSMLVIPPKTPHRIQNVGTTHLKLCSIYVPPEHPKDTVQKKRPF